MHDNLHFYRDTLLDSLLIWSVLVWYLPLVVCRLPLATREYIRTAGLRSTVAWAMASLAEINVSKH